MAAPLVALTATTKLIDGLPRVRLNEAYVDAVRAAGLVPVVIPPVDPDALDAVLDAVSGLVLTGGEDVDPAAYGATPRPEVASWHARRDACELDLARRARQRRIPTLAICRGVQVMNVALGGTLVQDIPTQRPSDVRHDQSARRTERVHAVRVEQDSLLAAAAGATALAVNSSHHQAVDRVADGLRVTARAPDDLVEGVEWVGVGDDWWMLGVQWHPEELVEDAQPWDRALFAAFSARVRS